MTREEAIRWINNFLESRKDGRGDTEIDIALKMAIPALEQEPCEDCISRAEAKRIVDFYTPQIDGIFRVNESIDELPSVQPIRTQGKWKTKGLGIYHCPLCGFSGKYPYDFCVCGADMRGAE